MTAQVRVRTADSLAYNTNGVGYEHNVEKQWEGCILKTSHISGKFLDSKVNYHTTRTSLTPGTQELGSKENSCIWIGMLPQNAMDYTSDALKASKDHGAQKRGQSIRAGQSPLIIANDLSALRVVVVFAHEQNKFFALINEKEGLSEAWRVKLEEIFFFSKFRDDDITSREQRGAVWSQKIKEYKDQIGKEVPQQPRREHARHDTLRVRKNFENELQGLLATYLRDPREVYLKAMQVAVQKADADLQHRPLAGEAIMAFVECKVEINQDLLQAAYDDMTVRSQQGP